MVAHAIGAKRYGSLVTGFALVVFAAPATAHAEQEDTGLFDTFATMVDRGANRVADRAAGSDPFGKGRWTADVFGMATSNINDQQALNLAGGGIGVNRYLEDGVAVRGELIGLAADQASDDDAGGGALNLLGRWHFYRKQRWSLFAEGGAGVMQTSVSVPDGPAIDDEDGTHFNFSLHAGVGTTYRLWENVHLQAAFRYTHISNADISGEDENPGIDSIGGYLGLMIPF